MSEEALEQPMPAKRKHPSAFAELMRQERRRLGLTQAEAARILGVNCKTVENWENDRFHVLGVTQEGALARYYGWQLHPENLKSMKNNE